MKFRFLENPPRFLLFTGKGGVGKTSIACATAIELASQGKKVLLVSTDPASNVGQVFGVKIGNTITALPQVPNLFALEINPEQAASAYREKIVSPVRGLLPERELKLIEEQLSGSCTTEIASFNEFTDLLSHPSATADYEHIVFDTAPTGHTIRLLQLPGSWTDFLNEGKGDASCLGPLAGLEKQRATYASAVETLKDHKQTRLVLVSRAQGASLSEASRTNSELLAIGIECGYLIVNAVLPQFAATDPISQSIYHREELALGEIPKDLTGLDIDIVHLKAANMVGIQALNSLLSDEDATGSLDVNLGGIGAPNEPLEKIVDELEEDGHGLIMCMGKGGVGKTTIAAAIAVALAERGHEVLLTTTDPAAHLTQTLDGSIPLLEVGRIDPLEATAEYRDSVMRTKGKNLDEIGRAALTEDLLSPCTEEVAVFQQFSKAVHDSRNKFVVIDTAPTGHTLLLLDAAGSYHREVAKKLGGSISFTTPLMRLQDPKATKVILVTLAESTPVKEAEELQRDLMRAGIKPFAWVINNSIAATSPESPLLQIRAESEIREIQRVESLATRFAIVPFVGREPVGVEALLSLTREVTSV